MIANFRLNVDKCHIAQTSIDYLGHHIEHSNIKPYAGNIRALLKTPQPTTAKEAFDLSKQQNIIANLYQAFNVLKRILTNDLVLHIPDERLPFKIQTDASKIGIGAVLMQIHPNGDLRIAYLSKKFTTTQMNWPATEQECYAIIYAIEKWHKYLDGREFIIETDHKPLLPFNLKKQLNAKCERWRLKLQQYKFSIRYIKGKHNTVADYLSRSPSDNASNDEDDHISSRSQATQTENSVVTSITASVVTRAQAKQQQQNERDDGLLTDQPCDERPSKRNVDSRIDRSCAPDHEGQPMNITEDQIIPFTYEQLKELQHQDEQTKHMITYIQQFSKYFVQNDMLMRRTSPPVPFVPKGRIRSDIIKIYHDTPANGGHFGRNKTTRKIQARYYWPNMVIRNRVKSCIPCLQNNHRRQKPPGALKPIKPPEGVWQLL
ncbi:unnamed protein product, partial [Didymodactylos carnosus]